jgi:hypothetical protein
MRTANPEVLARIAGWDAPLTDVVRRMRCSKCGGHGCTAAVRPQMKLVKDEVYIKPGSILVGPLQADSFSRALTSDIR